MSLSSHSRVAVSASYTLESGITIDLPRAPAEGNAEEFFLFASHLMIDGQWKGSPIEIDAPDDFPEERMDDLRHQLAQDIFQQAAEYGHPVALALFQAKMRAEDLAHQAAEVKSNQNINAQAVDAARQLETAEEVFLRAVEQAVHADDALQKGGSQDEWEHVKTPSSPGATNTHAITQARQELDQAQAGVDQCLSKMMVFDLAAIEANYKYIVYGEAKSLLVGRTLDRDADEILIVLKMMLQHSLNVNQVVNAKLEQDSKAFAEYKAEPRRYSQDQIHQMGVQIEPYVMPARQGNPEAIAMLDLNKDHYHAYRYLEYCFETEREINKLKQDIQGRGFPEFVVQLQKDIKAVESLITSYTQLRDQVDFAKKHLARLTDKEQFLADARNEEEFLLITARAVSPKTSKSIVSEDDKVAPPMPSETKLEASRPITGEDIATVTKRALVQVRLSRSLSSMWRVSTSDNCASPPPEFGTEFDGGLNTPSSLSPGMRQGSVV